MKHLYLLAALTLVACNSCIPAPAPSPTPVPTVVVPDAGPPPAMGGAAPVADAGAQPDIDRSVLDACENAHRLGCSEAQPVETCEVITQRALNAQITVVPLSCMVGATSKQVMQHCGFISCR